MKNREKFREEILEALAELFNSEADGVCRFMKKQVFPSYDLKKCAKEGTCGGVTCIDCAKMFAFWLDEEYEEPHTDWVNVPVDTLYQYDAIIFIIDTIARYLFVEAVNEEDVMQVGS